LKIFLTILAVLAITGNAFSDSGGPYEAVPDLRENESPPTFAIPPIDEPLYFYLRRMPELKWNKKLNEPDSITWAPINGYHASFRELGHVSGRRLVEVRYVSDQRLEQGVDFADSIIILARGFDSKPDSSKFMPIYYLSGGTSYDRRAEHLGDDHKYGAIKITEWWSGTGPGRWRSVFIGGTEKSEYKRFTP